MRMLLLVLMTGLLLQAQTGTEVPGLEALDEFVLTLMGRYRIPGGSMAVTRNGRLVYARGFGSVDSARTSRVQPDSLFRMPHAEMVTTVAILKLAEQGKLDLDKPAFDYLADLKAPFGAVQDARVKQITVRHLLLHTAGWDSGRRGGIDPLFASAQIVSALGVPAPASTENTIRYMLGQPLDFVPGTRNVYSSFGVSLLGRVIERVTGMSYEAWVRANILAPAGISRMRIGQTLAEGRFAGEVQYNGALGAPSAFADVAGPVPAAYGAFSIETADAPGGWVGSSIDYAKFLNAIDGQRGIRLLSAASVATMTARTAFSAPSSSTWNSMGAFVNAAGDWWGSGGMPGTATHFLRTGDGMAFVLQFNGLLPGQEGVSDEMERGLQDLRKKVTSWPLHDLFSDYPSVDPRVMAATPMIQGREGVVNGATFDRGVVAGSWFTIFGTNLAGSTRSWGGADIVGGALPESLNGTRVTVDGKPAFVYFVSPGQINAQAPAGLTPGWKRVEVIRNGVASGAVMAHVVASAPGALTYSLGGLTFAVATRNNSVLGDPALGAGLATCTPGDTITIYSTGLAASQAGVAVPAAATVANVQVTIGGKAATVAFAGLVSPGLFQINAVVPDVDTGNQPLLISTGSAKSPAGVVLAVKR